MGLVTSCCGRRPKKSRLRSEHDIGGHISKKTHKRAISATYSATQFEMSFSQLNINQATEEEFMTLPCITRSVAKNIIQYRSHIGGFRKVEDLALVSGVGANKLTLFKMEVYCGKMDVALSNPNTSSLTSNRRSYHRLNSKRGMDTILNVNDATVSELARIHGVGEVMAKQIVEYRNNYGPFQVITDVSRIPEIGTYHFEKIRHNLTLDDNLSTTSSTPPVWENQQHPETAPLLLNGIPNGEIRQGFHRKTSERTPVQTRTSQVQTDGVYLPFDFSKIPSRPATPARRANGAARGRATVRVASWNLKKFTKDKASNAGVKEVICLTILENKFNIIACQEIADKDALQVICDELNNPTILSLQCWDGARGHWECTTSGVAGRMFQGVEYNGFLWDKSKNVSLKDSSLLQPPRQGSQFSFARQPFIGYFKSKQLEFVLVCVHLKATGYDRRSKDRNQLMAEISQLPQLSDAIIEHLPDEYDIILAGDFNLDPSAEHFQWLSNAGFTNVLSSSSYTNISTKNMKGTHCYDNLWLSQKLHGVHTGKCGVIREGLTHPFIPDGWTWGGLVSDHCPVWAEFFADCDYDTDMEGMAEGISKRLSGLNFF